MATGQQWVDFLLGMGLAVRERIRREMLAGVDDLSHPAGEGGGDVLYRLDRHAEEAIRTYLAAKTAPVPPFLLIAEGIDDGCLAVGRGKSEYRVLCDPADGTRNIMFDKRSAWFLAAVSPDRGDATRLADTLASVMVELPPSKQDWADQFCAVAGQPVQSQRVHADDGRTRPVRVQPSRARDLSDGFAHVANFFPGTKVLASELMERIAAAGAGSAEPGKAKVFDDQYISTGGQMVELMLGHDRFCCDLRPLFYRALQARGAQVPCGLVCHPYDAAGWLVARQAGVVLTDGFGGALDAPLDVHHPVHWCGYANPSLRERIEPVLQTWLAEQGLR
jgi:fructose-1,6-bisphosphatase/inositol monophosphatase family enzyme